MFFKYLLLDLDDTLYDYTYSHDKGIEKVFAILSEHSKKSIQELTALYDLININLKKELSSTASSHNKSIYFKKMIEVLKLNLSFIRII
jgi:hypothetical protein